MEESRIGANGRTTLPKVVRAALDVQTGDRVGYIIDGDEVRVVAVRPINRLFGVLKRDGPPVTLDGMDAAVADGALRR
ncbi:MAG: AbrB/MazE/SpoVT family DNA-binding domain-containing protein [Chloroflexi bacterium]|nr:AbrB/MazE/SpoVT family DNA-binding domain-containing protein [Chloroflexota bacterium]